MGTDRHSCAMGQKYTHTHVHTYYPLSHGHRDPGYIWVLVFTRAHNPGYRSGSGAGFRSGITIRLRHNRISSVRKWRKKGRTWSDREMKLLLQIWSEERIQSQLRGAVWNDNVFRTIAEDLARQGFQRTVAFSFS